ncbi:MAG: hypothetical protein LAN83_18205 [Acidobacteriia bacterium]|nr:hypothetical protein [Terriglobia bacterium]
MLRSVIAVIAGYLVFAASAAALFKISGRDPHAPASLTFMGLSVLYGMFFAAVSGYIAARLAGRWEFEHSLAVAAVIAAGGAASLLASPGQALWTHLGALLIMAPMAMAGGYLRQRQAGSAKG